MIQTQYLQKYAWKKQDIWFQTACKLFSPGWRSCVWPATRPQLTILLAISCFVNCVMLHHLFSSSDTKRFSSASGWNSRGRKVSGDESWGWERAGYFHIIHEKEGTPLLLNQHCLETVALSNECICAVKVKCFLDSSMHHNVQILLSLQLRVGRFCFEVEY